jgi:hypothetical protein
VARKRRVREARPTMFTLDEIVGRVALIRRFAPPSPDGRRNVSHTLDACHITATTSNVASSAKSSRQNCVTPSMITSRKCVAEAEGFF